MAAMRRPSRTPHRAPQAAHVLGAASLVALVTLATVGASTGASAAAALRPPAAQPALSIYTRVYSKVQSARGEAAYKTSCGYCHKDDLTGGFLDDGVGRAPALAGPQAFGSSLVDRWRDQTLGDMVYAIASTMPKEAPTSLRLDTYVDIVAYLLDKNGVPAGDEELLPDVPTLREIVITAPPK